MRSSSNRVAIAGLRTSQGDIAADVVVDAAGAWGMRFLEDLGHELPIPSRVTPWP